MKMSIRYKVMLSFASVLLIALSIPIIGYQLNERYLARQVTENIGKTSILAAEQIENLRVDIEHDLHGIGHEYTKSQTVNHDVITITKHTLRQNPFLNQVTILSTSGREILKIDNFKQHEARTLGFESPTQPFEQAHKGLSGISKVYVIEDNGQNSSLIDFFVPVIASQGKIVAIIKGQVKLDQLWDILATVKVGQQGYAFVVDDEGRLIAHPNQERTKQAPNLATLPFIAELIYTEKTIAKETHYQNEQQILVIAGAQQVAGLDWVAVVEQPYEEAFAPLLTFNQIFWSTLITSVVILSFIGLLLSNHLTRPIRKLQKVAEELKHGKTVNKIIVKSGDEIEHLTRSFNAMAERLQASFKELHDQVTQLEGQKKRLDQSAQLLLRRDLELRETNEELEEQKETAESERDKLQIVLSGIKDGVIAVDLNEKIIIFNKAAEQITGYQAKDAIGRSITDILNSNYQTEKPDFKKIVEDHPHRRQVGDLTILESFPIHRVDEQSAYLDMSIGRIKDQKIANLDCIVAFHDISQEKELERMKLDFVSMAAHELRTPLTTILGYLSFLKKEKTQIKLTDNEQEFVQNALLSAERLNKLIENLLVVSRIEQGRMNITAEPLDVTPLIEKIIQEMQGLAKAKRLTLELEIDGPLPMVMGEKISVEEVITNLIGNAINYTQKGGARLLAHKEKDRVVIAVKDTGIGIDEEAQKHLFTKFFRAKGDLQTGSKGTGLGLYISKRIIDALDGEIWLESKAGEGSTFFFSLPIAPQDK